MLLSNNRNHPPVEHWFIWNELWILEHNFTSFKRREKENGNSIIKTNKAAQLLRYVPMIENVECHHMHFQVFRVLRE